MIAFDSIKKLDRQDNEAHIPDDLSDGVGVVALAMGEKWWF